MFLEVKSMLMNIAPYLPFLSAAVVSKEQLNLGSLVSRLLESAIIAAVILYANVQVMDTKVKHVQDAIIDIRQDDDRIEKHIEDNRTKLNAILIQLEGVRKDIQHQKERSQN